MNKFDRRAPTPETAVSLSRRGFMIGTAGAGLMLAFARHGLAETSPDQALADGAYEPNLWCRIDSDGIITVNVIRAEMGQHVGTALARILADELEADWDKLRIAHVDSDPKWGTMVTGGSWSVWQSFMPLSQAGAAARMALIEEGAKLLGVAASKCTARNSSVIAGGRSIAYADIVKRGKMTRSYSADELKAMPVKSPDQRRLVGHETRAIDIPDKTDGKAIYGIDAKVEGMVHARPKIPPTRNGSKVVAIDDSVAKSVKGYLSSISLEDPSNTVPGWVMVFADSVSAAIRAADLVKVEWSSDDTVAISEKDILDHGAALIADASTGSMVFNDEGVDDAFKSADSTLEQTYTTASVLHFALEPINALAFEKDGQWEIHTGNQWQSLAIPVLAKALAVDEARVVMRTYRLGGGFGRRLNGDYAIPAALASKALGKPVKMTCTRADDLRFDSFRSPSIQRVRMAFDKNRKVIAMQHDAAAGWPTKVMVPSFMPKGLNGEPYDPFSISGADSWYSVGAQRVRAISNEMANRAFRPGWLRSVGPGWTNWASESFIDEAALKIGMDPVAFRLLLLDGKGRNAGSAPNSVGGALRQAAVVKRLAEKSKWGKLALPADSGVGFATTFGQERDMPTWVACVAQVQVDRATGIVRLQKLTLVVDAGTVVHPDGALAQVEGGALWGASMALHEGSEFINGQVKDTNLDTYAPMRMADVPELDIEFLSSTETAVGLGEPATTVVGPAIGNAIFAAIGVRLRHIPVKPGDILDGLKKSPKA